MPEGGHDEIHIQTIIDNVDVLDHLSDAVAQEESGGMSGVVAEEVEVWPPGAPRSDAEGVVEAQVAAALRATIEERA